MDRSDVHAPGPDLVSARRLLEKYLNSDSEVITLLEFAQQHRLDEDDMVFLLTTTLRINENLVIQLLGAIEAVEHLIGQAGQARSDMEAQLGSHSSTLIGQLKAAAGESAGKLSLEVRRLEVAIEQTRLLGGQMQAAARDYQDVRSLVKNLFGTTDGVSASRATIAHITGAIRYELEKYGDVIADRIEKQMVLRTRVRLVVSAAQLVITGIILVLLLR